MSEYDTERSVKITANIEIHPAGFELLYGIAIEKIEYLESILKKFQHDDISKEEIQQLCFEYFENNKI